MEFIRPGLGSYYIFNAINLFVLTLLVAGVHYSNKVLSPEKKVPLVHFVVGLFIWLAATSLGPHFGLLVKYPMPGFPLFFAAAILGASLFAFSTIGTNLARSLPVWTIVLFQGFRLPLELVLHDWVNRGTIPATMTWTGQNFDIVTGVLGILAAPLAGKNKSIAWGFNIIGFALLVNVGRVAVLSAPLPFSWGVKPPLVLAAYFPYCLIGTICVAGALLGHLILFRSLVMNRSQA